MIMVYAHEPEHDQLAQHRAPLPAVQIRADAKGTQTRMSKLLDLGVLLSAQHIDHVLCSETEPAALLAAIDAGHELAGRFGAIPHLRWGEAVVAVVAGLGALA